MLNKTLDDTIEKRNDPIKIIMTQTKKAHFNNWIKNPL